MFLVLLVGYFLFKTTDRTGTLQGPIRFQLGPVPPWPHHWICPWRNSDMSGTEAITVTLCTSADSQPTKLRGAFFWLFAFLEGGEGSTSLETGNSVSCCLIITVISFWIWGVAEKKHKWHNDQNLKILYLYKFPYITFFWCLFSLFCTFMLFCTEKDVLMPHVNA